MYLTAPRAGEQRHGRIGFRVFLWDRKNQLLVLMKDALQARYIAEELHEKGHQHRRRSGKIEDSNTNLSKQIQLARN